MKCLFCDRCSTIVNKKMSDLDKLTQPCSSLYVVNVYDAHWKDLNYCDATFFVTI